GGILAVGFRNGSISFYDARTLKFCSEVDCKNRKGKFAKGRKVTSLEWLPDGTSLLVATNDSRIRIFDVSSLTCVYKFKGHVNAQIMLRASYTANGLGVVCGSEIGRISYWRVGGPAADLLDSQRTRLPHWKRVTNSSLEEFKAFDELLTFAVAAPPAFSAALFSYLSIHPLPSRAPQLSRRPTLLQQQQQQQQQQRQQQQRQFRSGISSISSSPPSCQ
ncbi:hypothetical protein, conserved, partial [Eimeria tenella]